MFPLVLRRIGLIAAALLLLSAGPALAQERRVALVVGANAYRSIAPLSNAVADARAVADRLRGLGFEVVGPVLDPTRREFNTALDQFEVALQGAGLGLFFYAGHAVEVGGRNLLLPVDAPAATSERQLRSDAIDAQEILAGVLARAPRAVMILDACRDNPLPRDPTRGNRPAVGGTRGLEPIEAPRRDDGGSFVVLAAAPGEVALDRLPGTDPDPNGLFTRHLLRALDNPARPLPALMGEVRDAVAAAARGANRRQVPELTDRMVGSGGVLLAALPVAPQAPALAPPPVRPAAVPQVAPETIELAFWQSIQGSRNAADFDEYLRRYPSGLFAGLARNRLAELSAPPPAPPRPFPVGVGERFQDCADCPEMVVIPPGRFVMGSPAAERGRENDEGPQRDVTLHAAIAIGRGPVTVAEFRAFADATGHQTPGGCWRWNPQENKDELAPSLNWRSPGFRQEDSHPVVCVSWDDAQAYLRWLSQQSGQRYRLPTEAEWEYAARAGTRTRWWWGESEAAQCRHANGLDQRMVQVANVWSRYQVAPCNDGFPYTSPIARFTANRFGLHDMGGNAWQWVQDCYRDSYAGAPSDAGQSVESSGNACSARVRRGGSWDDTPQYLRAANRGWNSPGFRGNNIGFRVARTPGG